MKKLRGFRLVCLGLIIYTPLFLYQFYIDFNVSIWVFIVFAIPSGICLFTGLFQMHKRKEDELDDNLRNSMNEKKYDKH